MKRFLISLVCSVACYMSYVQGQNFTKTDSTKVGKYYEIELRDGSSFIGSIVCIDSTTVTFKTNSIDKIKIPVHQIADMVLIKRESIKQGRYWMPNPMPTRYFFAPSAISLHKNEGYYQNTCIIMNSFNYGFTDNFSVGIGMDILSPFIALTTGSSFSPFFYITPKVGFKVADNLYLGGGLLFASVGYYDLRDEDNSNKTIELGYALATFGSIEHNFTLGVGNGFRYGEYVKKPTFILCGMTRVGRRIALITENWLAPARNSQYHSSYDPMTLQSTSWYTHTYNYNVLFSYGMRFIANKISIDLGFVNNNDIFNTIFIGIPYADFVVKF